MLIHIFQDLYIVTTKSETSLSKDMHLQTAAEERIFSPTVTT